MAVTIETSGTPGTFSLLRLRPPDAVHVPFLLTLASSEAFFGRWRFSRSTPNPQGMLATLWENALYQVIAEDAATGETLGLLLCSGAAPKDGWAYLTVVPAAPGLPGSRFTLAFLQFVDFVFASWPLSRLYVEFPARLRRVTDGLEHYFLDVLAELPERRFNLGRYEAEAIAQIERERWHDFRPPGCAISALYDPVALDAAADRFPTLDEFVEQLSPLWHGVGPAASDPSTTLGELKLSQFDLRLLELAVAKSARLTAPREFGFAANTSLRDVHLALCEFTSQPSGREIPRQGAAREVGLASLAGQR